MSNASSAKKVVRKKKAANGYKLPDPLPNGEILTDVLKKKWQIGPSIGVGGFGEIYSASDVISSPKKNASNPYAIKIEPHGNGPLFVEMHVYMKLGKEELINEWKKQKKLTHLGMPRFIGSGSHESKGIKYRFVIMDRFSKDIWSLFLQNNRVFPCQTVIKLGYQVLNILEYFHSKSYVHADIKGTNLMLGLKKGTENQVYLVDLGLASSFSKDYKPNPLKAHNGTPEYTSRDAHIGVPSMRGDLEILGFNMLQWLCSKLPWEDDLADVVNLQQKKIKFMKDVADNLKKCFSKNKETPPEFLVKYFEHVAALAIEEVPNYGHCFRLFKEGLKKCDSSLDGKLEFTSSKKTPSKVSKSSKLVSRKVKLHDDSEDLIDVTPPKKPRVLAVKKTNNTNSKVKGVVKIQKKTLLLDNEDSDESNDEVSDEINESDEHEDSDSLSPQKVLKKPKKPTVAVKPSWRDCPTAIASKVERPGEYTASRKGKQARKQQ